MCARDLRTEANADLDTEVVVIGAGIAGLVAAWDIARLGYRVRVLERSDWVGGRMHAISLAGLPIELGAESFATRGGAVAALLGELGLAASIVTPRRRPAWTVASGASYRMPAAGALGIPVHPFAADTRRVLGLRGAWGLALEPWRPRSLLPATASLAEIARERLGQDVLEKLIAPVTEGVHSASPDALRLDAHPELEREYARTGSLLRSARLARASRSAAGGAVQSLAGGMSVLIARLVRELRAEGAAVHTGVRDLSLDRDGKGWAVRWAGGECSAQSVVLAVPPSVSEQLLANSDANAEHPSAQATPCQSNAVGTAVETVVVVVTEPRLVSAPRGTGALIRAGHPRIRAKALTHMNAKWAWLDQAVEPGTHVLRLSYGSRGGTPATEALSGAEAAELALSDASEVFGIRLDPDNVQAHARARWVIPPRSSASAPAPGVVVTGEAYAGTGLASVVPHARAAARTVISALSKSHRREPPT